MALAADGSTASCEAGDHLGILSLSMIRALIPSGRSGLLAIVRDDGAGIQPAVLEQALCQFADTGGGNVVIRQAGVDGV